MSHKYETLQMFCPIDALYFKICNSYETVVEFDIYEFLITRNDEEGLYIHIKESATECRISRISKYFVQQCLRIISLYELV